MARDPKADARHYLIDGQKVVRVSTVLSVIAKPGLIYWYGKWGAEECRRLSKIATDFGTRFHKAMELHAQGLLLPWDVDDDIRPHVDAARAWFDANVLEVVGIERRVHSKRHGYAGTADLLARVRDFAEDRPAALDWKTSKEVAFEYGFQLSAYLEGANEDGLDLDGRIVLWAPREQPGVFTAHAFPPDEHAADYAAFLDALKLWRRVEELERRQRAAWARRKREAERRAG
jgi:hypothetical protein